MERETEEKREKDNFRPMNTETLIGEMRKEERQEATHTHTHTQRERVMCPRSNRQTYVTG